MFAYLRATSVAGVAVLAAMLVLAARAPAAACPNADTVAASASKQAMRDAVRCLVNKQRVAHGLPPLRASARLTRSAQGWSDEMVASRTFSHGTDFAARISDAG